MTNTEQISIEHHLSSGDLLKKIKFLEKNTRVLQHLYFVRYGYESASVAEASKAAGISIPVAYQWQDR